MAKYYYAAFIPAGENWFSIFCPDFPEVASQGETVGECMDMATEALALTVEEYAKARKPLPEPCGLEEARRRIEEELAELEIEAAGEILYQLIPAPSVDLTPVKISLSIAKSVLESIDAKAARSGMTRSGFMAAAAQAYDVQRPGASC